MLIIGGNTLLMFLMRYGANAHHLWPVLAVIGAGAVVEMVFVWLKPSAHRPGALRAFAFFVPWFILLW